MAAAIECEACGKKFAWSPQFAGKKMKCKCGAAITIPAERPASKPSAAPAPATVAATSSRSPASGKSSGSAPPLPKKKPAPPPVPIDEPIIEVSSNDEPMIEIAEPVVAMGGGGAAVLACPSCNSALSPGAIMCVGCGYNLQLRRKMVAAPTKVVASDRVMTDETDTAYMIREKIAPPVLAVLGFIMVVAFMAAEQAAANAEWAAEWGDGEAEAVSIGGIVIYVGVTTAVSVFFMIIGCFVAAKLLDTNFGSLTTAPIKLAGVVLISDGVTQMATYFLGMGGVFVDMTIGIALYWGLLMWLFELDGFEVAVTAVIFWVLKWVGLLVFVMMLISFGFGLFAALGGGGGGGMTMPGGDDVMYEEGYDDEMMFEDEEGMGIQPEGQLQDPNAVPADPNAEPAVPEGEAPPTDGSAAAWPWAPQVQQMLATPHFWDSRMWDPRMDAHRYRLRVVTA